MKDKMNNCVIYQITNTINQKIYIGSAVYFAQRKGEHLYKLRRNIHPNKHLQNSFNKYGETVFKFDILEYCTKDTLIEKEQHYLDTLNPNYNCLKIAYSSMGFKHSKETKELLSMKFKGMQRSKGRVLGEESKRKQALAKSKPVLQFDSEMNFIREWESSKVAATILLGKSSRKSGITDCIRGRTPKAFGFIWKSKEKFELCRVRDESK